MMRIFAVEIEGYRYELGEVSGQRGCNSCCLFDTCPSLLRKFCGRLDPGITCTSKTKIEPEAKVYHEVNREEARGLIGKDVEGYIRGVWAPGTLKQIDEVTYDSRPFDIGGRWVEFIRESPKVYLTESELRKKYGIGDNVVIVKGGI